MGHLHHQQRGGIGGTADFLSLLWAEDRREQVDEVEDFFGRIVRAQSGKEISVIGGEFSEFGEVNIESKRGVELLELGIIIVSLGCDGAALRDLVEVKSPTSVTFAPLPRSIVRTK